jgi:hypothetical protein
MRILVFWVILATLLAVLELPPIQQAPCHAPGKRAFFRKNKYLTTQPTAPKPRSSIFFLYSRRRGEADKQAISTRWAYPTPHSFFIGIFGVSSPQQFSMIGGLVFFIALGNVKRCISVQVSHATVHDGRSRQLSPPEGTQDLRNGG